MLLYQVILRNSNRILSQSCFQADFLLKMENGDWKWFQTSVKELLNHIKNKSLCIGFHIFLTLFLNKNWKNYAYRLTVNKNYNMITLQFWSKIAIFFLIFISIFSKNGFLSEYMKKDQFIWGPRATTLYNYYVNQVWFQETDVFIIFNLIFG